MVSINGEYNVGAAVIQRAKTGGLGLEVGGASAHSQITEVSYIISGNGTLVTGRPILKPFATAPERRHRVTAPELLGDEAPK
jgi:hypothetical protein